MNWHSKTAENALLHNKVKRDEGLTTEQVANRKHFGRNVIESKRDKPLIVRFFMQFNDFMVVILLFAAGLSYFAGWLHGEPNITDPLIILFIVALVSGVSRTFLVVYVEKSKFAGRSMF